MIARQGKAVKSNREHRQQFSLDRLGIFHLGLATCVSAVGLKLLGKLGSGDAARW